MGLAWQDVTPALELIDSIDELRDAVVHPNAFVRRLGEVSKPAALRLIIEQLEPVLTKRLERMGVTWNEVLPAIELVDSIDELRRALEEPDAFLRALARRQGQWRHDWS